MKKAIPIVVTVILAPIIMGFVVYYLQNPKIVPPPSVIEEQPVIALEAEAKLEKPTPKKVAQAPKPTTSKPSPTVEPLQIKQEPKYMVVEEPKKEEQKPEPIPTQTPAPEPTPQPPAPQQPVSQKNITFHTEKKVDGEVTTYDYYAVVFGDDGKSIMSDVYFHANVDYKCKCGSKIPAERGQSIGDEIRYIVTGSSYPGENMGVEATAIDMVKSFPFAQ